MNFIKQNYQTLIIIFSIVCVAIFTYILYKWLSKGFRPINEGFMFLPELNLKFPISTSPSTSPSTSLSTNISYQIPIPANQLQDNQLRDLDTDIIRNVRVLANFSKTDELDFYQMYTIIKLLKGNYTFPYDPSTITPTYLTNSQNTIELSSGAIKNADLELYTRIKLELISALNKLIIENDLYTKYHNYVFFKIIGSNLISIDSISSPSSPSSPTPSPSQNWIFSIKIGREYKYIQFTLYFDIDVMQDGSNCVINVNKVEILGIPIPNDTTFHSNQHTTDMPELTQDTSNTDTDIMPYGEGMFKQADTKFIDLMEVSDMSPNYFDNDSLSAKIEDKIMAQSKDVYFNSHKCFSLINGKSKELPEYKWPAFCESYHPEVNQNGIWDAPCQLDSDCPFYKANKNYPNEFGKCDKETGKCQMPQGIIPIGFTKYAKQEADCYNCGMDTLSNKCCSRQADDINAENVPYKSPDYIFENDFQLRKQNIKIIEDNGLHVNPSI
uniref:Uncharacterized protein n=1 Tax=viral metagenome TaxID=1070528 RepID=A0A6C0HN85_9ZZZZ